MNVSREIKFRAWDKKLKSMAKVISLSFYEDDSTYKGSETESFLYFEKLDTTSLRPFNEIELMQCTGLKGYMNDSFNECEQKDVYQGDHITITYDSCYGGFYAEEKYSGVVDLDDTGTAFVLRNADYERHGEDIPNRIGDMEITFSFPDDDDLEQIYLHAFELLPDNIIINGNIYKNPELLKER